ncbi:hypothetical protein L209DRAFT_761860 [Thermothelomyces heterothallicus CBS 203.75]
MPIAQETTVVPQGATPRLGAIKEKKGLPPLRTAAATGPDIIDIRHAAVEINLKAEVLAQFHARDGPRKLPTLLLYDENGLQLFEKITYLEEYYLTNDEIAVLKSYAADIVKYIPSGAMVIELGSGNLRKVNLLLQALEDAAKDIDYYALDLSQQELERTLALLPPYKHVRAHGLLGTYDDGRLWLKDPTVATRQKCILSLGSSVGNFDRREAGAFLKSFADVLGPDDTMLIGLDACDDPAKVYLTPRCSLDKRAWGHSSHPIPDTRHPRVSRARWRVVTSIIGGFWAAGPRMAFSLTPSIYARTALPSMRDWEGLWAAWDVVTRDMLPPEEILEKPIKLRNACIFYLGHIPTFLDIQLTKTTKQPATDPASYYGIFERGIDPDVDNPELCHAHSEIPDEWPPVDEIRAYQGRVRTRLQSLYAAGIDAIPRHVGRAIWVGFEHEAMHLETLLYMMLQSGRTRPPPRVPAPDFESLAAKARSERVPNQWFDIPEQEVVIGLDDPEDGTDPHAPYGWDNEKPLRRVKVHAFQAQGRPISNEEYARYLYNTRTTKIPASWAQIPGGTVKAGDETVAAGGGIDSAEADNNNNENGPTNSHSFANDVALPESFLDDKAVRTVYGLVPLKHALDWPVFASYDELAGCAAWMGGRIPTFEEVRSIYKHAEALKKEQAENQLSQTVPAVNGHLTNNGVEISPPATPPGSTDAGSEADSRDRRLSQEDLFIDLNGANVGFSHWHPTAVMSRGNQLGGQSDAGGVWEWTSSVLRPWDGFQAMPLYPGYTADFFDEKHNIVLGGSWATHPRLAGRKSFVNWYQRNYPYAWIGARLVRDVE